MICEMVLAFDQGAGHQTGQRCVQSNRHAAAHGGEQLLHQSRFKLLNFRNGSEHQNKANDGAHKTQFQQQVAHKVTQGMRIL